MKLILTDTLENLSIESKVLNLNKFKNERTKRVKSRDLLEYLNDIVRFKILSRPILSFQDTLTTFLHVYGYIFSKS